jgi:DNA-binding NtrC family response regulator
VKHTVEDFIGVSAVMQAIRAEVEYAAGCNAKVLLTGESGVGKEVASRRIHQLSARSDAPLVAINCVGIPESLLESELFGHVRGSFTGAHRDRVGLLEMAHRGTVFLDEVGEMGPRMQALLLRFLETGEIQRVGADRVQSKLDVRVIAATNRDPIEHVAAKTFRADLYYRLNVIDITIPPLRSRREDIPVLLEHFLLRYSIQNGITAPVVHPEAMAAMAGYDWPGNVRQLKNTAERLIVRGCGGVITIDDLPPVVLGGQSLTIVEDVSAGDAAAPAMPVTYVRDPAGRPVVDQMFDRMVKQRESFWSVVYSAYMVRDLTRADLRAIVTRGLQETAGNYKMLVELFNMERTDYKRFLNFLRKQDCQVPFAHFRAVSSWHRDVPDARFRPSTSAGNVQLRH